MDRQKNNILGVKSVTQPIATTGTVSKKKSHGEEEKTSLEKRNRSKTESANEWGV